MWALEVVKMKVQTDSGNWYTSELNIIPTLRFINQIDTPVYKPESTNGVKYQ